MEQAARLQKSRQDRDLVQMLYTIKGIAESYLPKIQDSKVHQFEEILNQIKASLSQTLKRADYILNQIHEPLSVPGREEAARPDHANFPQCVERILEILHQEFAFDRITVVKIFSHDLPLLPVSQEHLDAMMFQLLLQARRAIGRSGGLLTIEAHEEMNGSSEPCGERRLTVRVSDTGPMIPEDDLDHLFDPVFAARSYRFEDGLGLYTVRKIIERYGGSVRVENKFRQAAFYLDVPLA
ncbi:MAG: HAMP domain-containing histidine kinase [Candidatus Omnitrophica bacterium]|nr:HAMP domain-containing histidine kinase [Candidatus Omnitrophota bacterium]